MKPQIGFFLVSLQGPSLIISLAQLASPSVAPPAELVLIQSLTRLNTSDQRLVFRYLLERFTKYSQSLFSPPQ